MPDNSFIPISKIDLEESIPLVIEVLRSGNIAQGAQVARLEETFAELSGVKFGVAVNNGTSALYLALKSLELGPDDEVITSPFTFGATLNAILATGAKAKFVDISESDFNLDPSKIESAISPNTKVLLPVHLYGQMADMNPIKEIAIRNNLEIVEDSSQSAFARYEDRMAGSFGLGCFSFYATKNFTSGEGGIVLTSNEALARKLRILRNQGMESKYQYVLSSLNYRMTDVAAAILLPQLVNREEIHKKRLFNASRLIELLTECPSIQLPKQIDGRHHVWHQFTILISEDCDLSRDEVVEKLNEEKIGASVYYPKLVNNYECFRNNDRISVTNLLVATSIANRCFSIPVHQYLSESDLERIADALLGIFV